MPARDAAPPRVTPRAVLAAQARRRHVVPCHRCTRETLAAYNELCPLCPACLYVVSWGCCAWFAVNCRRES